MIGRSGATLKKFRERHNVEVLFPDRLESDSKLASEIHVIGDKEAVAKAVADLQQTVKLMEDETEASVDCDDTVLQDLWRYRNAFHYPELDRVKVIFPKSSNSPVTRRGPQATNGGEHAGNTIRIFGPKGCVEVRLSLTKIPSISSLHLPFLFRSRRRLNSASRKSLRIFNPKRRLNVLLLN